ncbi:MAG TPA: pilus assembly protein [Brevundimonas sp.]|uniref:pilus assembly protein n=1 Tax=Brevundimonas sp. TaxID=1871086 RepID=UPI00262D5364|nr:pilus assembly protein [Brevundimonas sp.]HRO34126.1 pilus assembly protein [Brevundimonas sp.]
MGGIGHVVGDWTRRLKGFAGRFARARRGNVAMIFALSLPPLILMTLGGVDIHRASTVRVNLQDALDAAALAAARSPYTTNAEISTVGLAALRANLKAYPQITLREDQTSFVLNEEGIVVAKSKVDVKALVANIFLPPYGQFMDDKLPVGAHSEVYRSNKMVEIALVLDNTGSMQGTKLTNTKTAARDLIDRLAAADARSVEPDAVKIALVPFSMTVRPHAGFSSTGNRTGASNLGWVSRATNHTGSTGATGLFATGQDRFALLDTMQIGWSGCIESRPYPNDVRDTAPSSGNQATMFVPYFAPDSPDRDTFPNDSTWRNYSYDNDYLDEPTTSLTGLISNLLSTLTNTLRLQAWDRLGKDDSKYVRSRLRSGIGVNLGPNQGCGLEPVMRLTDNYEGLKSAVSRMAATGTTNIPMGLMWGWHALSPNAPYRDGRAYGTERLQKIIILMTDGENVNNTASNPDNSTYTGVGMIWQNRLGVGSSSSGTQRRNAMDSRLEELCVNLRANDVILYTVGVQVDTRTQELLRGCATVPANYFNVSNAGGIGQAFDRIAGAIENLRIAK